MEDFTLPRVASKNGSDVHPFSQNTRPILISQKKNSEKNAKIAKKGRPAHNLSACGS
jgi:hypothetical protein